MAAGERVRAVVVVAAASGRFALVQCGLPRRDNETPGELVSTNVERLFTYELDQPSFVSTSAPSSARWNHLDHSTRASYQLSLVVAGVVKDVVVAPMH